MMSMSDSGRNRRSTLLCITELKRFPFWRAGGMVHAVEHQRTATAERVAVLNLDFA